MAEIACFNCRRKDIELKYLREEVGSLRDFLGAIPQIHGPVQVPEAILHNQVRWETSYDYQTGVITLFIPGALEPPQEVQG